MQGVSEGRSGSFTMKKTIIIGFIFAVVVLLSSCTGFRVENPLNIKCPSCGYEWSSAPEY